MKCISCEKFSFFVICQKCQKDFFDVEYHKRKLDTNFDVYSFYEYTNIKEYLESKYYFYGDRVYKILAKLTFKKFAKNFYFNEPVTALIINDNSIKEFSNNAILAKELKTDTISIDYTSLMATNKIKYAGKSVEFRNKNKREFIYTGEQNKNIILIDDIVTTGNTMKEAREVLLKK